MIDDGNDLRGQHFRDLLGRPEISLSIVLVVLVAGVAGALVLGIPLGAAIAAGLLLAAALILLRIADRRAADDFFEAYAEEQGWQLGGSSELPQATQLLCRGDRRYATKTLTGALGEGVEGTLALYVFEEDTRGDRNTQTTRSRFTVAIVAVPECEELVPELYCQRKFGFRSMERLEDALRHTKKRVKLESEVFDEKYEIFVAEDQDPVWLRRLFSPSFLAWLIDSAPPKFAFELYRGGLCCFVPGHRESAAELNALAAATTTVVRRLRAEASE